MPGLAAFLLLALMLAAIAEFVSIFGLQVVIWKTAQLALLFVLAAAIQWVIKRVYFKNKR